MMVVDSLRKEGDFMGAWGTSLYANDCAGDIRGDYVDKLKRGKTNLEATRELLAENQEILADGEEAPLFWFALADTQWNYGRLLPEVKEKALLYLSREQEWERWKESGEKQLQAWKITLTKLREKLETTQPPEKRVSQYRLYRCQWQLGDVFAYRFAGSYAEKMGFSGQYVLFRKVSEGICWPGHILPVVQVYKWIGSRIPDLASVAQLPLLEQGFYSSVLIRHPDAKRVYSIMLLSTSPKAVPKENLTYLGNIPGEDLTPLPGENHENSFPGVGWEASRYNTKFEQYILSMYLSWKEVQPLCPPGKTSQL